MPFFRDNNQLELEKKKNNSNNELFCTSEGNWAVSAVLLKSWCIYYILNDFCRRAKVSIHNAFWLNKKKAVEKSAQLHENKRNLQFNLHRYRNRLPVVVIVVTSDKF